MKMVWVYFWLANYDIIDIFLNKFDFLDEKKAPKSFAKLWGLLSGGNVSYLLSTLQLSKLSRHSISS